MRLNQTRRHREARKLLEHGDAVCVTLDGQPIAPAQALDLLRDDAGLDQVDAGAFAKKLDAFEAQLAEVELGIPRTVVRAKVGRWILAGLDCAPDESLKRTQTLHIQTRDGTTVKVEAEAIDLQNSALLKRLSSLINAGSSIPFMVGTCVGYGAVTLSAAAAVGAHAMGKQKWGGALMRLATKHLILSTVTNLPVVGSLACVVCAARDHRDQARLSRAEKSTSASVQDTVNLAQHGRATLRPEMPTVDATTGAFVSSDR